MTRLTTTEIKKRRKKKSRLKKKLTAPDAERWNDQMYVVRVFDQLIYNTDRNLGNLLITKDWTIWMIDHSRAFRMSHTLLTEKNLAKCERHLLEAMKKLDMPTLQAAFGIYVTKPEIEGLLKRRDRIVSFFDKAGEASLYTITPWP